MSLTPNEDKVRAIRLLPDIKDAMLRPGQPGVDARVVVAMMDAYALATAQEFDRGSPAEQIVMAFANALGQIVGSLAVGSSEASKEISRSILSQISLVCGRTLEAHDAGLLPSVSIGLDQAGRA